VSQPISIPRWLLGLIAIGSPLLGVGGSWGTVRADLRSIDKNVVEMRHDLNSFGDRLRSLELVYTGTRNETETLKAEVTALRQKTDRLTDAFGRIEGMDRDIQRLWAANDMTNARLIVIEKKMPTATEKSNPKE